MSVQTTLARSLTYDVDVTSSSSRRADRTSTNPEQLTENAAFGRRVECSCEAWMNNYVEGTYVDHSQPSLSYEEFVKLELVQFSKYPSA